MFYFKEKKYTTISPWEVVKCIQNGGNFPEKRFLIAFDDGYKNNYTDAFPILKECNFSAVIFLTTSHCGKINDWPYQHNSIPRLPMLSWKEIKEMSSYGIEFGAHTQNHPRLTEVSICKAKDEIIRSKIEIEEKLDKPVDFFSYPFGSYDARVREVVMTMFKGAISNRAGKVHAKSDAYALERINATSQLFKLIPFEVLFLGSFDYYLFLKKILNKSKALKRKWIRASKT